MEEKLVFKAKTVDDLIAISPSFLEQTKGKKIFAFYGDMGAGKTTFIKQLTKSMGIEGEASSPTYGLVNEYFSPFYGKVYHFDCYRLESEEEAYDIGIEEYFYEEVYTFIEWPEKIDNLLPENTVSVKITLGTDNERIIEVEL